MRWPQASMVAADVRGTAVNRLRARREDWRVYKCDFLRESTSGGASSLLPLEGKVDVVVLNPPFTCRGGSKWRVSTRDGLTDCSIAMAFLLTAASYLRPGGQVVAILPLGAVTSLRDQGAWQILRGAGQTRIVARIDDGQFPGYRPRTVIVRYTRGRPAGARQAQETSPSSRRRSSPVAGEVIRLVRGQIQMHGRPSLNGGRRVRLVHTTDLRPPIQGALQAVWVPAELATVSGPAVLLPRVGKPDLRKVRLYLTGERIAISDCVIAALCDSSSAAHKVRQAIERRWQGVKNLYGGTGAPYLTLRALSEFLSRSGAVTVLHTAGHCGYTTADTGVQLNAVWRGDGAE